MADLRKHYGVLFNRKSGSIVKTIEANGSALLKLYGMQGNVSATRDYVVFREDGEIVFYCEGKKNDIPTIHRDMEGMDINEICEGLLESLA